MSQKGIKNTEEKGILEQETGKIVSKATAIAMFLLLVIFPVFITSQHYMNILRMKYKFFWVMVVVLAAVSVFVGAVFLFHLVSCEERFFAHLSKIVKNFRQFFFDLHT